jgi:hypothetical protein
MLFAFSTTSSIEPTSGKIAWPARHYWWEVVGYDVETDFITHSTTFETEEAALEAYNAFKTQKGAKVLTEDGRPDLEYVIADGVEYVLNACDEQAVYFEEAEGHAALDI